MTVSKSSKNFQRFLIKNKNKCSKFNKNFITADFETILVNERHYISLYTIVDENGIIASDSYCNYEFSTENQFVNISKSILKTFLESIYDYNKKQIRTVYFHNFSKFDSIFLLEYLCSDTQFEIVDIISRDNYLYSLTLKKDDIIMSFCDSYLYLPFKLEELSITFETKKKKIDVRFSYFY